MCACINIGLPFYIKKKLKKTSRFLLNQKQLINIHRDPIQSLQNRKKNVLKSVERFSFNFLDQYEKLEAFPPSWILTLFVRVFDVFNSRVNSV